jgi:hypothetical protein
MNEHPHDPTVYTCPMHPQIVRDAPGSCPISGMALEPRTATAGEEENPELRQMTRRFWVGVALTIPLLLLAMSTMLPLGAKLAPAGRPDRPDGGRGSAQPRSDPAAPATPPSRPRSRTLTRASPLSEEEMP